MLLLAVLVWLLFTRLLNRFGRGRHRARVVSTRIISSQPTRQATRLSRQDRALRAVSNMESDLPDEVASWCELNSAATEAVVVEKASEVPAVGAAARAAEMPAEEVLIEPQAELTTSRV